MTALPVGARQKDRVAGRVTVVTPTLNAQAFVEATVASVLAQTYGDVEYIIVDGGSSDATLQIAGRSAANAKIMIVPGSNQAAAINAGFSAGSGEFFAFLNADDTFEPDAMESAVRHLQAQPDAALAYAEADHIGPDGKVLGPYPVTAADLFALSRECVICQPATLMRSDAFALVGGMDERLNFALDYDLWIRMYGLGRPFVRVRERWAQSRMHGANKTLGKRAVVYSEVFAVLQRHFGYVPFNWIHAYAGYMLDKKDHFFEEPTGSPLRAALTILLGLKENKHKRLTFAKDYITEMLRFHRPAL